MRFSGFETRGECSGTAYSAVKMEGEALAKPPKKGKGQKAAWRSTTEGCAKGVLPDMDGSLWDPVHERREKGHRD